MFSKLKNIIQKIKKLSLSVDNYKKESIIQSLPTVAYVNRAKKFLIEKKYTEAEQILKSALDISDQDALVYKYLGKILEFRLDYNKAIEHYKKSAKLNPQDKEIWLRLGMCQLNIKDFESSIKSFEHADKITPLNTDVQTGWGMALMRQKKYAHARDKFILASKINKYNYAAIHLCAVMDVRLCDYEAAETKLKFLTKVAPNEGSMYEYANLKLIKSDYKTSLEYAQKALGYNKQMLPAYFILGEIYSIQKDYENMQNTYRIAAENDLDCEMLQFEWGKACVRLFDFSEAKKHFDLSLEKNKNYSEAKIGLALINSLNGDFELLKELREKHGNNVYIQESIGLYYLSKEKYEDAIEMFKKALRTDSKQTYNLLHIARTYKKLNNKEKIKEYYEKFVAENPQYIKGFIEYAQYLTEIKEYADAKRKLQKAQKLDSDNLDILNLMFYLSYMLVKDNVSEYNLKEAIKIADKVKILGDFKYEPEKEELEKILKEIQG